jgi:GNAT superfamily N-acetyltransferase
MALEWIRENPPYWDLDKDRILGGAEPGTLQLPVHAPGDLLPGEWWRVEDRGTVIGYGWMDCTWGDAEILLAVDPSRRGGGVGTFILDRLEEEGRERGVNYLYNRVRPTHPRRREVAEWLEARRFERSPDERLMRRVAPYPARSRSSDQG